MVISKTGNVLLLKPYPSLIVKTADLSEYQHSSIKCFLSCISLNVDTHASSITWELDSSSNCHQGPVKQKC